MRNWIQKTSVSSSPSMSRWSGCPSWFQRCMGPLPSAVCTHTVLVEMDWVRPLSLHVCLLPQHRVVLTHDCLVLSDKQMIRLRDSPENMLAGQMPHGDILLLIMILLTRFILGTEWTLLASIQLFLLNQSRSESCEVCRQNPHWYHSLSENGCKVSAWRR